MGEWVQAAVLALGGSGATILVQWLKGRTARSAASLSSNVKLQEHWTETTLELVDRLRAEVKDAREELASLRSMQARLAHFEEALDHIHALLAAEGDVEVKAAERRARAFLRRMRGEEKRGEERQAVQRHISAKRIEHDAESGKTDE